MKIFNPAHDLFTIQTLRLPSPWSFKHKIINNKRRPENFDIFNPPPPSVVLYVFNYMAWKLSVATWNSIKNFKNITNKFINTNVIHIGQGIHGLWSGIQTSKDYYLIKIYRYYQSTKNKHFNENVIKLSQIEMNSHCLGEKNKWLAHQRYTDQWWSMIKKDQWW